MYDFPSVTHRSCAGCSGVSHVRGPPSPQGVAHGRRSDLPGVFPRLGPLLKKFGWLCGLQEYHQQVHGEKAFSSWHGAQYPGQTLEMEEWRKFESKETSFPAFARNVMYTMNFDVPSYFGSLTTSLSCTPSCRACSAPCLTWGVTDGGRKILNSSKPSELQLKLY